MELSEKELKYLKNRKFLVKWLRILVAIVGGGFAAFFLWLYLKAPAILVYPVQTAERLKEGSICQSTVVMMAGLMPVMLVMCLFAVRL